MHRQLIRIILAVGTIAAAPASAKLVDIVITVTNLAPTNSVSLAPVRFGLNSGTFDSFDEGGTPTEPIITIAEGGSGSAWFPAFAAADPTAVLGSTNGGPITPGSVASSNKIRVNTKVNPYFTFAAMVVPSNDYFIGNDDPREYRLFDAKGNLLIGSITQTASDIWNAGSELFDPLNAAFLVIGTNALRTPENGTTGFDFAQLSGFNGLTTAAGYVFDSQLAAGLPISQISFTVTDVPEPAIAALLALGTLTIGLRARRRARG